MAARKTYWREGYLLKRCVGGYAASINGHVFIFRNNPLNDAPSVPRWTAIGQHHKARNAAGALADAVLWAAGHTNYCPGGCDENYSPFANVKVEPRKPTDPASDDCHTFS